MNLNACIGGVHRAPEYAAASQPINLRSTVNVLAAVDSNLTLAVSLADRLQKAMDYILNSEPEKVAEGQKGLSGPPVGWLDAVNDKNRLVYSQLDRIDTQLRRLEGVVG